MARPVGWSRSREDGSATRGRLALFLLPILLSVSAQESAGAPWSDAPLLHNSFRFACSLSPYAIEADCTDHGGVWDLSRKWPGGWGAPGQRYGGITCATCHVRNPGNGNIKRLRPAITASADSFPGSTVTAARAVVGMSSDYGDDGGGHESSNRICEVCHSLTIYHRFDTTAQAAEGGSLDHFNSADCVSCHLHKQGFRAGCSDCHGNSLTGEARPDDTANNINIAYSWADDAGSHARHVASLGTGNASCASCHPLPTPGGSTHINLNVEVTGSGFGYTKETGTCSAVTCHGNTDAQWGASGCLNCHSVVQGARAAIAGQFAANSHHIQGVAATGAHCYQCHWEARSDGTIDSTYHGGAASAGAAVDLVIYGAGSRPLTYAFASTALQYSANGTRSEIQKINSHCLGCHSSQNDAATPFGDGKTPNQYAWDASDASDGTSIGSRYSQSETTPWGKYSGANITPKATRTKAYSAHGNAVSNQGGWDLSETWSNTRGGSENIACFDCHNSHGSTVAGRTTSYASATVNGGLLKDTQASHGGYSVTYKPSAGGTADDKNLRSPGASLCFDCHLTATGGVSTPWGYQETFGATKQILGYFDTAHFAPGFSGHQQRYGYRQKISFKGGHLGASSPLKTAAAESINGLCTPCHDPHGVSPILSTNQPYGVPLLKGTWMTSPYREDVAPVANILQTIRTDLGREGVHYNIDQNTFGSDITGTVAGIAQTDQQFAGLCLRCHTRSSLTDGVTHTWKSRDRVHESVNGWKSANATVKHKYTCSKCHAPHTGPALPRLMVTNCLDSSHKGRVGSASPPVTSDAGDAGSGRIPGSYSYWDDGQGQTVDRTAACHEGPNAYRDGGKDQSWNEVTPWYVEDPLKIEIGPAAGKFETAGTNLQATITWTTNLPGSSYVDYGMTAAYGLTAGNPSLVPSHTVQLAGLANHSNYHYRVRSSSYKEQQISSGDQIFYISLPPTVPTLVDEPDAACASDCTVSLEWNASTDPLDGGPIEYYAEVSASPSFSSVLANSGWISGTSWEAPLATNTFYYWRVKSRDANHATAEDPPSAWSAVDSFFTSDGSVPQVALVSPAHGFSGYGYDSIYYATFSWTYVGALPQGYQVQVSTDPAFATLSASSGWITATTWSVSLGTVANSSTVFYWRAQGRSLSGTVGPWSATWSFTIQDYGASGSCPFLFTWDGEKFVFEADLYGAGKLATRTRTGYLKPEPHDYYLLKSTPGLRGNRYELRLVEERLEADYLDELQLYTIDAPADRLVFAEKPQAGSSAPFAGIGAVLHTIAQNAPAPLSAIHVNSGTDVTAKLAAADGDMVVLNSDRNIGFTYQTLELDLGDIASAAPVKIAIDAVSVFPDSAEGVARSATFGARTILEVQDGAGDWVVVPADKGALPKAPEFSRPYVFDISNIWAGASRKVRFTFLFKTYIDWIRVDTTADGPLAIERVPMVSATLAEHGLDGKSTDGEIYQYVYGAPNDLRGYLPGSYTRTGDVLPLLVSTDDKFVIFGGGDEIVMTFGLPAPPAPGLERSFLVYTNGYYKDVKVDVPHTVEPLPFGSMSNFPYDPALEHYPDDAEHEQYRREYNTRHTP